MCEQLAGSPTRRRLQNGLNRLAHAVNVLYFINRNFTCSVPLPTHFALYAVSNRQDSQYIFVVGVFCCDHERTSTNILHNLKISFVFYGTGSILDK